MNHLQNSLVQLKNGYNAHKSEITIYNTKKSVQILKILKTHGLIKTWAPVNTRELKVYLRYAFASPCIKTLTSFIKPSIPCYVSVEDLSKFKHSLGILILNTSYGLITKDKALAQRVGGTLVCHLK